MKNTDSLIKKYLTEAKKPNVECMECGKRFNRVALKPENQYAARSAGQLISKQFRRNMETYKKYLPRDKRIDESGVPKHINKIIDGLEDVMMEFEMQKEEAADDNLKKSFKVMDQAYTKWVQQFRRHAKMASQSLK